MAVEPGRLRRGMVVLIRLPGDKARPAVVLRSDALARLPYATVAAFVGIRTSSTCERGAWLRR
jgi:mRNA-degrading endonuclease toxin of MazEF toxin-antitoxin module